MGFFHAVGTCLRKFYVFSGRARRSEYWYFILFVILGTAVAGVLDVMLAGTLDSTKSGAGLRIQIVSDGAITWLFSLAMVLPGLAAGWRRMHDTGRSGFYLVYPMIVMLGIGGFANLMAGVNPMFGGEVGAVVSGTGMAVMTLAFVVWLVSPLLVLWWLTRPGQPGQNAFGPPPANSVWRKN